MPTADTARTTTKTRPTFVPLDGAKPEDVANEGFETIKEASESANRIAGEYASMCSDTLAAALQSGSQVAHMLTDVGRAYADACACSASTMAEIARESVTCRTPGDVVKLQKKAMDGMNAIVEASAKVYGGIFAAYAKAAEPMFARTADAPERIFRAFAD